MPEARRQPRPLTIGTAGHVDHGKTVLVEALTGTDTDRLPDERRRGISIELGFAELALDGGRRLSLVDVPGHERLVRTMVAGASGIDLFLMVVAADDGVMPQTREHLAVLRALGVERGVVALTKIDAVDEATRALGAEEARALLPRAPLVEVSAHTGAGLRELRAALGREAELADAVSSAPGGTARSPILHADRAFTLHGTGTVLTGTLDGGALRAGDRVRLLPRGRETRVRSLQVHGRPCELAEPGQRVAVALSGVRRDEVERGDVLAAPGAQVRPSYRLDVELRLERQAGDLDGERVQVHHGTRDVPARVVRVADGALAQLRCEAPLIAREGDRVVLRRIAPPDTIGGGVVLDPAPPRHRGQAAAERLARIRSHGLDAVLAAERQRAREAPAAAAGRDRRQAAQATPGRREALALALLERDGAEPRSPRALAEALHMQPREAEDALARLVDAGRATRIGRDVYYSTAQLERVRAVAVAAARERGELTLAQLRDALGTSRKYAQALLEHLDSSKVTVRRGDVHELRRHG